MNEHIRKPLYITGFYLIYVWLVIYVAIALADKHSSIAIYCRMTYFQGYKNLRIVKNLL